MNTGRGRGKGQRTGRGPQPGAGLDGAGLDDAGLDGARERWVRTGGIELCVAELGIRHSPR